MEKKKTNALVILCVTIVLIIMIIIGSVLDKKNSKADETGDVPPSVLTNVPEFTINSSFEDNDCIVLETTYGDFRYSKSLTDIICFETSNTGNFSQLDAFVVINEKKVLAYTIYFNKNKGTYCGIFNLNENYKSIAVYITFEQLSSSIPAESENSFYAVQDTVNDVISSMRENGTFVYVD